MSHLVVYTSAAGVETFERAADLESAVRVVERLRNDSGVEAEIFALEQVQIAFRPYYRVEVGGAGPDLTTGGPSAPTSAAPSSPPGPGLSPTVAPSLTSLTAGGTAPRASGGPLVAPLPSRPPVGTMAPPAPAPAPAPPAPAAAPPAPAPPAPAPPAPVIADLADEYDDTISLDDDAPNARRGLFGRA